MNVSLHFRPSLVLVLCALASADCGEESSTPSDVDVIYQGGATDEGLEALLAKTVQDVPAEAAHLTWPVDGDMLPKADPLSFWFEVEGEEARLGSPRDKRRRDMRTRHASRDARPFDSTFGLGDLPPILLAPLWSIPQEARAHGTPISGRAYYLVASTKDNPALLRVFTTGLDYEPDAAALEILHGAGGPVTVVITNAVFEENRVVEEGGPFKGTPITIEFLD